MAATAAQLAIAKASLSAVLLRSEPDLKSAPCSRADIDEFAGLLALAAARCSPANVQTCKKWILRHVAHSPARTSAVGRYLVALSNSFTDATRKDKTTINKTTKNKETSARRKRLHILYIVNDVLYHVTFRRKNDNKEKETDDSRPPFVTNIEPSLLPLISSAATFIRAPKQLAKLNDLIDLWAYQHYVGDDIIKELKTAVDHGPRRAEELQKKSKDDKNVKEVKESANPKEAPFLLPALHGDPSAPWYDLPAATWLAVLEPNSTRPMNPALLKPLQLAPGPAPPALEASVRALLADVDRMFGDESTATTATEKPDVDSDVSPLGEHIDVDVVSGDIVGGDTYYGWSRVFCKSMKERRQRWKDGDKRQDVSPDRGRARSRNEMSRSPSQSPRHSSKPSFKRRRISASPGSRGRSYSRSQSRSRSRSRDRRREDKSQSGLHVPGHRYHDGKGSSSRSPQGRKHRRRSGSRSRSRSRSRTRSKSRAKRRYRSRSRSKSRSRSRSRSYSRSPKRHRDRDHRDRDRYSRSPHKDGYDYNHGHGHGHNEQSFPVQGRTPPPHLQHNLPPVPYNLQQQGQMYQEQHQQHQQPQYGGHPHPPYPGFPPPPHPGMNPGHFPFVPPPPVPPPGYQGQWPPPIPPPHAWPGGAPPPPPPRHGPPVGGWAGGWDPNAPPPPQHQQQYPPQHYDQRNQPYDQRGGNGSWDQSRGW